MQIEIRLLFSSSIPPSSLGEKSYLRERKKEGKKKDLERETGRQIETEEKKGMTDGMSSRLAENLFVMRGSK